MKKLIKVVLWVFILNVVLSQYLVWITQDVSAKVSTSIAAPQTDNLNKFFNKENRLRSLSWFKNTAKVAINQDGLSVIKEYSNLYWIKNVDQEIKFVREQKNTIKWTSAWRFAQYYNWLRVLWWEFVVHKNNIGQIESIDSNYYSNINISTTPTLTKQQAESIAQSAMTWTDNVYKDTLLIFPFEWKNYLAYEILLWWVWRKWIYYVDANNWKILFKYNNIQNLDIIHSTWTNVGIQWNLLDGEWWGSTSFTWWYDNDKYYAISSANKFYIYNSWRYSNPDVNNYASYTWADWGSYNPDAISAYQNVNRTLDYLKNIAWFDLSAYFPTWTQDIIWTKNWLSVRIHDAEYDNNGYYDPSDRSVNLWHWDWVAIWSLAVLDFVAHELWHFVTDMTSNLIYRWESWALNESFSDIIWVNVEFAYQEDNTASYPNKSAWKSDWVRGEDCSLNSFVHRDFVNPQSNIVYMKQPSRYRGPRRISRDWDNWWVHINSGIQNYFYYLLINWWRWNNDWISYDLTWIWLLPAREIAFDVQTNRLLATDWFYEAKQAWITSAQSLYPQYADNVRAAWEAVWVFDNPQAPTNPSRDFEWLSGDFAWKNWKNVWDWNYKWTVVEDTNWSKVLNPSQVVLNGASNLSITWYTNTGFVTFDMKVTTGSINDYIYFYVDGNITYTNFEWAQDWNMKSYYVWAGYHTFRWKFWKYSTTWDNGIYIDNINFPSEVSGNVLYNHGNYYTNTWTIDLSMSSKIWTDYSVFGTWLLSYSWTVLTTWINNLELNLENIEWEKQISTTLIDKLSNKSLIVTWSVYLDITWPTTPTIVSPIVNAQISGDVSFAWNESTDLGVWMSGYVYQISTDSNFVQAISWVVYTNSMSKTWFNDGIYFVRVKGFDKYNQESTWSEPVSFVVDKTAPAAPTDLSISVNAINYTNQYNVILSWNGGLNDTWVVAMYTMTNGTQTISWVWNANWTFVLYVDASSLGDGMIWVDVKIKDLAWNISNSAQLSIVKDTLVPTWSIEFLSWTYSNQTSTSIICHWSENWIFMLSWNVAENTTWKLNQSKTIVLSSGDWRKNISWIFIDDAGNRSIEYTNSIVLDTTLPVISVNNYQNNSQVSLSQIDLNWANSDLNWIKSFSINWVANADLLNWSKTINLSWWINHIILQAADNAWNVSTNNLNIIRVAQTSNISYNFDTDWSVNIEFNTDFPAYWGVYFSTNTGSIENVFTWALTTNHKIKLSWLNENTTYYYQVYGSFDGYKWARSSVKSFKTPNLVDPLDQWRQDVVWGVLFSGFTQTWFVFNSIQLINILNEDDSDNAIALSTDNLTIITSGASWDWIINPPRLVPFTGSFVWTDWFQRVSALTFRAWSDITNLTFSWWVVQVTLDVWIIYNDKTLKVYSSVDNWVTFTALSTCRVREWLCKFFTTHFSDFTVWVPTESSNNWGGSSNWWSTYMPTTIQPTSQVTNLVENVKDIVVVPEVVQDTIKDNVNLLYQNLYKKLLAQNLDEEKMHKQLVALLNSIKLNSDWSDKLKSIQDLIQKDVDSYKPKKLNNTPKITLAPAEVYQVIAHIAPNGKPYVIKKYKRGYTFNSKSYYTKLDQILAVIDLNNK